MLVGVHGGGDVCSDPSIIQRSYHFKSYFPHSIFQIPLSVFLKVVILKAYFHVYLWLLKGGGSLRALVLRDVSHVKPMRNMPFVGHTFRCQRRW